MKKVQFTETVLRDASQSLIATRLPYEKMEPTPIRASSLTISTYFSRVCTGLVV